MATKQDIINKIIAEGAYFKTTVKDSNGKNRKVIIDLWTAGILKQVFDKASQENIEKLNNASWQGLSNLAYKLVK